MSFCAYLLFVAVTCGSRALALTGVRASVPYEAASGRPATLRCLFDLEGDSLYSVKWYKGRHEFYRYTQTDTPHVKTFPVPGLRQLRVQVSESDEPGRVSLSEVSPPLARRYSCEVSADSPSFQTALATGHMHVVVVPSDRPAVDGVKRRYPVGGQMRASCTSARSRPAANVTWAINGRPVDKRFVKVYDVIRENPNDLETSSSILEKILTLDDFNSKGKLKIRCTASISSIYWQTTEKSAELETYQSYDSGERPTTGLREWGNGKKSESGARRITCSLLPLLLLLPTLL